MTVSPTPEAAAQRPLDGVRVLDLSRVVAGPFAGRMLSDLGADVVKVEPPDGDLTRHWGRETAGITGFFTQQNAGKRNICIDLKADGARDLVLELVAAADLVIENYRPGVLDRLGLGYDAMQAANPKVILLSISGFGIGNEWSGRAAFAPILHAESGLLGRQAAFDQAAPTDPMLSIADYDSALHGLVGLLSALWMRERTGLGQHIDMAMLNAMVATDDYGHHALDDYPVERLGGQVWATSYGHILTSGNSKAQWWQLSKAGKVADETLPDGASIEDKIAMRERVLTDFYQSFAERDDLVAALDDANVAWADIRDPFDVFETPVAAERRLSTEIDDRAGGTRRVVESPYRFSAAEAGVRGPAAHRGEHNAEVLAEWLDAGPRAAELEASGVLHAAFPQPDEPAES